MNLNKVFLSGAITRDVQLKKIASGTSLAEFGLAINRTFMVDKKKREEVCFVDCQCWGPRGEVIAARLGKGDPIFIEGRLTFSSWDDKQTGAKRSKLTVTVDDFQFIGKKQTQGDASGEPQRPPQRQAPRTSEKPAPPPDEETQKFDPDDIAF